MYIPKYSSAFLDERSETSIGELFIGVSDVGQIVGIPYQGTIKKNFIKKKVKQYFESHVKCDSKINFSSCIQVDIIDINYQERKLTTYCNEYENYLE